MKKTTKRLLSFLLVFVMMFSILPTTAFAAGVTTISKEFKDFYTNMPIDHKNRLFDVGIGQRTAQVEFFAENRFCYGVEWSAVSADPEIVSINEDESIRTGVSYRPFSI